MMPHKFAATIINNQILLLKLCQKKKKKKTNCTFTFFCEARAEKQRTENRSMQQCLSARVKGRRMAAIICKTCKVHTHTTKKQMKLVKKKKIIICSKLVLFF